MIAGALISVGVWACHRFQLPMIDGRLRGIAANLPSAPTRPATKSPHHISSSPPVHQDLTSGADGHKSNIHSANPPQFCFGRRLEVCNANLAHWMDTYTYLARSFQSIQSVFMCMCFTFLSKEWIGFLKCCFIDFQCSLAKESLPWQVKDKCKSMSMTIRHALCKAATSRVYRWKVGVIWWLVGNGCELQKPTSQGCPHVKREIRKLHTLAPMAEGAVEVRRNLAQGTPVRHSSHLDDLWKMASAKNRHFSHLSEPLVFVPHLPLPLMGGKTLPKCFPQRSIHNIMRWANNYRHMYDIKPARVSVVSSAHSQMTGDGHRIGVFPHGDSRFYIHVTDRFIRSRVVDGNWHLVPLRT
uniref:HDC19538 n=1 Tax=Drosophila melanogaster TaxID=7227 RepID=Q6II72_DROME|nr:TPA_inf: HDC19538 [Drosophila melanogaster]